MLGPLVTRSQSVADMSSLQANYYEDEKYGQSQAYFISTLADYRRSKQVDTSSNVMSKDKNDEMRRSTVDIRAEQFEKNLVENKIKSSKNNSSILMRSPITSVAVKSAVAFWEKKQKIMLGFSPGKRFFNKNDALADVNENNDDNKKKMKNEKMTKNNDNNNADDVIDKNNLNFKISEGFVPEAPALRRKEMTSENPFDSTPRYVAFFCSNVFSYLLLLIQFNFFIWMQHDK